MNRIEKINELKSKNPFKLFDIIIVAALLILSVCLIIFVPQKKGAYIEVYVDNRLVLTYSLSVDCEIKIPTNNGEHFNTVKIENGYVYVTDADCSDKVCIHTGKINTESKSIICLPHNLKIIIKGSVDGTARLFNYVIFRYAR